MQKMSDSKTSNEKTEKIDITKINGAGHEATMIDESPMTISIPTTTTAVSPSASAPMFFISPKNVLEQYLRKLGYMPLRFKEMQDQQRRDGTEALQQRLLFPPNCIEHEDERSVWFRKERLIPPPGSIRGSVFNLAGATLGAGALSLPYAIAVSGVLFATIQLLVATFLTVYTVRLLIHAGEITGLKSYEDLAVHCFGQKVAAIVEINILIFCFGISVAYLVTFGDILTPLGEIVFGSTSFFAQRWFLMTFFCSTVMLPLSLLKDISKLQSPSILGVLSIFFLVFSVAIRSIAKVTEEGLPDDISWMLNTSHGFNFMLSVPIVMFAFTCQVNVFSIYTELQRPCIRRMSKVVDRASIISFLVYFVMGITAYLAFGSTLIDPSKKGNILLSFPLNDTLIAISRAAITFTVSVAFPLNVFPCRFTLEMMFFSKSPPSELRHTVITILLVFAALSLAIFCPSINVVFGIIGGTCSAFVCFCLPAAFILVLEPGSIFTSTKLGPLILLISAIILGAMGTYITVWTNLH